MTIIDFLSMTEKEIYKTFLKKAIEQDRDIKTDDDNYLYLSGNIPLCLVAHVDTVGGKQHLKQFHLYNDRITASMDKKPCILGADDRAGVYILYEKMLGIQRPHILLTNYEERGAVGASKFVKDYPTMRNITMFVELDRRGADHFVVYNENPPEAIEFIRNCCLRFDGYGSFSDIKILSDQYKIPSVNLATGYYNEHTSQEYLVIDHLETVNQRLQTIINRFPRKGDFGKIEDKPQSYLWDADPDYNWRESRYYANAKKGIK